MRAVSAKAARMCGTCTQFGGAERKPRGSAAASSPAMHDDPGWCDQGVQVDVCVVSYLIPYFKHGLVSARAVPSRSAVPVRILEDHWDGHAHSDQEHPPHTLGRNVLYYGRDIEFLMPAVLVFDILTCVSRLFVS